MIFFKDSPRVALFSVGKLKFYDKVAGAATSNDVSFSRCKKLNEMILIGTMVYHRCDEIEIHETPFIKLDFF